MRRSLVWSCSLPPGFQHEIVGGWGSVEEEATPRQGAEATDLVIFVHVARCSLVQESQKFEHCWLHSLAISAGDSVIPTAARGKPARAKGAGNPPVVAHSPRDCPPVKWDVQAGWELGLAGNSGLPKGRGWTVPNPEKDHPDR